MNDEAWRKAVAIQKQKALELERLRRSSRMVNRSRSVMTHGHARLTRAATADTLSVDPRLMGARPASRDAPPLPAVPAVPDAKDAPPPLPALPGLSKSTSDPVLERQVSAPVISVAIVEEEEEEEDDDDELLPEPDDQEKQSKEEEQEEEIKSVYTERHMEFALAPASQQPRRKSLLALPAFGDEDMNKAVAASNTVVEVLDPWDLIPSRGRASTLSTSTLDHLRREKERRAQISNKSVRRRQSKLVSKLQQKATRAEQFLLAARGVCETCNSVPPSLYCLMCEKSVCIKCSSSTHRDLVLRWHKRVPLNKSEAYQRQAAVPHSKEFKEMALLRSRMDADQGKREEERMQAKSQRMKQFARTMMDGYVLCEPEKLNPLRDSQSAKADRRGGCVYISFDTSDKDKADRIRNALSARGRFVWYGMHHEDADTPLPPASASSPSSSSSSSSSNKPRARVSISGSHRSLLKALDDEEEEEEEVKLGGLDDAPDQLELDENIQYSILLRVQQSDFVVMVISQQSLRSTSCAFELAHAIRTSKLIIPVVFDHLDFSQAPKLLQPLHWVFFSSHAVADQEDAALDAAHFERASGLLNELLSSHLAHARFHTYLLARALEWKHQDCDLAIFLHGKEKKHAAQWLQACALGQSPFPSALILSFVAASLGLRSDKIMAAEEEESKGQKRVSLSAPASRRTSVYITCSRAVDADVEFAQSLTKTLRSQQRTVWVDTVFADISQPSFQTKQATAFQAIEEHDVFVFIMSPDSLQSDRCLFELNHAISMGKRIVPVVFKEINLQLVPQSLATLTWIFMRAKGDSIVSSYKLLYQDLDIDAAYTMTHTSVSKKAQEWNSSERPRQLVLTDDELVAAEEWLLECALGKEKGPIATQLMLDYLSASQESAACVIL